MEYLKEVETLQTWIKQTTNVNSCRLSEAKPKLARPVILFETPSRSTDRYISRYIYVNKVRQYAKLFARSMDELLELQENLMQDIEARENTLAVAGPNGVLGYLKAVKVTFDNSENLDVAFNIEYEVAYSKPKPADPPPATKVGTKIRANS